MRFSILGLALLAAAVGTQLVASPAAADTVTVNADDNFFAPATIEITVGDTVQWEFVGSNPHSVTSQTAGLFDSGVQTGGTFTHTFNSGGTFAYICTVHGASMSGTVVVSQAAPTNTPAPESTDTPAPTDTPDTSASPTEAAGATSTPLATETTAAPASTASPGQGGAATPTTAAGQPGGAQQLPSSGSGAPRSGDGSWLAWALGAAGAVLVLGAGAWRVVPVRRRR